jgi:hypothetical protein
MSYAEQLERLQEMRAQTRALEKQLEREARSMQPITEQDERRMYADQVEFDPAGPILTETCGRAAAAVVALGEGRP